MPLCWKRGVLTTGPPGKSTEENFDSLLEIIPSEGAGKLSRNITKILKSHRPSVFQQNKDSCQLKKIFFLNSLISSMHARVHMCVCCTHLSVFGDGQHTRSSGLKLLAVLEAKRREPKGSVLVLPLPGDRFRSTRAVSPGRGRPVWRMFVAHGHGGVWPTQSGGCWVGSPDTVLSFSSLPFPGRAALFSALLTSPSCGCWPRPGGARLNPGRGVSPCPPASETRRPRGRKWVQVGRNEGMGPGSLEARVVRAPSRQLPAFQPLSFRSAQGRGQKCTASR